MGRGLKRYRKSKGPSSGEATTARLPAEFSEGDEERVDQLAAQAAEDASREKQMEILEREIARREAAGEVGEEDMEAAPGERPADAGNNGLGQLSCLMQMTRNSTKSLALQEETLAVSKKTASAIEDLTAVSEQSVELQKSRANAQTRKDCRGILEPYMKRHTFYPETAALEMVARKVMGMETVAEARQHDSGKFANIRQTAGDVARVNIRSDLTKTCKAAIYQHYSGPSKPWNQDGDWVQQYASDFLGGCLYRKHHAKEDSHFSKLWRSTLLAIWPHPSGTEVLDEDRPYETVIRHLTASMVGYVETVIQYLLESGVSDLPSKGEAATAFKDRYATIVDGLKKTKSAYIVIKEVNQAQQET